MTLPARLADLDFPKRHEDWRWTDLRAVEAALEAKPAARPEVDLSRWLVPGVDGPVLLFVNGRYDEAASRSGPSVRIEERREAPERGPLGKIAARHSAAKIVIGAGEERVQVVHVATGGQAHLDLHYDIQAGGTARVVETYAGGGDSWTNVVVTASVAKGARLRRAVRLLMQGGVWTEDVMGSVADGAHYGSVALIGGAQAVRSEYELALGDEAHAQVDGTMVAGGRQHYDVVGRVRHEGVGGTSGQTWRSVAAKKAQVSFAGRIEVERGAQKTNAEEDVKALLLDRTATANAKPELEISRRRCEMRARRDGRRAGQGGAVLHAEPRSAA